MLVVHHTFQFRVLDILHFCRCYTNQYKNIICETTQHSAALLHSAFKPVQLLY